MTESDATMTRIGQGPIHPACHPHNGSGVRGPRNRATAL
jgi:hypothetical protein